MTYFMVQPRMGLGKAPVYPLALHEDQFFPRQPWIAFERQERFDFEGMIRKVGDKERFWIEYRKEA